jgi:hypothetical protein
LARSFGIIAASRSAPRKISPPSLQACAEPCATASARLDIAEGLRSNEIRRHFLALPENDRLTLALKAIDAADKRKRWRQLSLALRSSPVSAISSAICCYGGGNAFEYEVG